MKEEAREDVSFINGFSFFSSCFHSDVLLVAKLIASFAGVHQLSRTIKDSECENEQKSKHVRVNDSGDSYIQVQASGRQ